MELFARGLLIGLAIAAPVGPIGILCIKRTLTEGRAAALASGLGAATADASYAAVAAFGLSALSSALMEHAETLRLIGGIFLTYLGVRSWTAHSATGGRGPNQVRGLAQHFASTFALTLANPMTILSFVAVFSGLDLSALGGSTSRPAELVAGVYAGSALWWLTLSWSVGMFRKLVQDGAIKAVNRLASALIAGFGIALLASLLK